MYFSTNEKGDFCDFAMRFYRIATTFSSQPTYNVYDVQRTHRSTAVVHPSKHAKAIS